MDGSSKGLAGIPFPLGDAGYAGVCRDVLQMEGAPIILHDEVSGINPRQS